jgi:hypothetical protein
MESRLTRMIALLQKVADDAAGYDIPTILLDAASLLEEQVRPVDAYTSHVTILRVELNGFLIVFDRTPAKTTCLDLTYDEMLGCIAKMFCPAMDGRPLFSPKQLFLTSDKSQETQS